MLKRIYNYIKTKWKQVLLFLFGGAIVVYATVNVRAPALTNEISLDKMITKYESQTTTTDKLVRVQDKYKLRDATLVIPAKSRNDIQIKIGDKTKTDFTPDFEITKWENEVSFKIKPRVSGIATKDKNLEFVGDKIKFTTPKIDYEFYDIPATTTYPEGAYIMEIILLEKPDSNIVEMDIEVSGLDFSYQPALNEEMQGQDCWTIACTPIDCCDSYRPIEIVGSYAIFHSEQSGDYSTLGGNNYKTGKIGMFYKPKIIDANGDWIWGGLFIDENIGIITYTIDQNWLNSAIYPISIK